MSDTLTAPPAGLAAERGPRWPRVALALGLLAYVGLFAALLPIKGRYGSLVLAAVAPVLLLVLVGLLARCRLSEGPATATVVGGATVLQLVALRTGPSTSDDVYRYVWDGKVQLSGIDPYAYAPDSPQLAHLRDGLLFGPTSTCAHAIPGGCTAINRPDVHTIYPPVAEALFVLVRLVSFGQGGVRPFQIAAALGVMAITGLLVQHLRRAGRSLWPVALWAWSPLVVIEYGNNGHIDWSGVLLGLLALLAAARGRAGWAGLLLGAATLTKLYPAVIAPALLRRRPLVVLAAAALTIVVAYVPHVLAVGRAVIGYLPGYLQEEGYDSGSRTLLLGAFLPHPIDTVSGVLVVVAAAVWCWRHARPTAPEHAATIMLGVVFLVATPAYGWYAGLLLALVVVSARYEWLPLVLAPNLVYLVRSNFTHSALPATIIYAAAAVAVGGIAGLRRGRSRSARVSRG